MTKYIIKNCPNLGSNEEAKFFCNDTVFFCEEINNCIFKRIVEKCKEQKVPTIWNCKNDTEYFIHSARHILAQDILSMLEIEECE